MANYSVVSVTNEAQAAELEQAIADGIPEGSRLLAYQREAVLRIVAGKLRHYVGPSSESPLPLRESTLPIRDDIVSVVWLED